MPGTLLSRLSNSSDSPSEKYSWSLRALTSANGSTAMECSGTTLAAGTAAFCSRERASSARAASCASQSRAIAAISSTPIAAIAGQRIGSAPWNRRSSGGMDRRTAGLRGAGQECADLLTELGRRLTGGKPCPLHRAKLVRHARAGIRRVVDDYREQEWRVIGHQVGAIHRQLPLQTKIALTAFVRVRGDHRDEQGAVVDLLADLVIPDVPAAQFALVEPDLDPGGPQRLADTACRLGILGGVA